MPEIKQSSAGKALKAYGARIGVGHLPTVVWAGAWCAMNNASGRWRHCLRPVLVNMGQSTSPFTKALPWNFGRDRKESDTFFVSQHGLQLNNYGGTSRFLKSKIPAIPKLLAFTSQKRERAFLVFRFKWRKEYMPTIFWLKVRVDSLIYVEFQTTGGKYDGRGGRGKTSHHGRYFLQVFLVVEHCIQHYNISRQVRKCGHC